MLKGEDMIERNRKRDMDRDIQADIESLTLDGYSPKQIELYLKNKLDKEVEQGEVKERRFQPELRTIQRTATDIKFPDTSGRWSIGDYEGEDARVVLDVLSSCMLYHTSMIGYNNFFSKTQAHWVIKLSKAAPDAPHRIITTLVYLYMSKASKGIVETTDLDVYLAFTPWKNSGCLRLYKSLVAKGNIPAVPWWPILVDELSNGKTLDPRFKSDPYPVRRYERDIYAKIQGGKSVDEIADYYKIAPNDVIDIKQKYENQGTQ
jgi:hypothetical protein